MAPSWIQVLQQGHAPLPHHPSSVLAQPCRRCSLTTTWSQECDSPAGSPLVTALPSSAPVEVDASFHLFALLPWSSRTLAGLSFCAPGLIQSIDPLLAGRHCPLVDLATKLSRSDWPPCNLASQKDLGKHAILKPTDLGLPIALVMPSSLCLGSRIADRPTYHTNLVASSRHPPCSPGNKAAFGHQSRCDLANLATWQLGNLTSLDPMRLVGLAAEPGLSDLVGWSLNSLCHPGDYKPGWPGL